MFITLKFVASVVKELNSETSPNQMAAGFAFGALLGLIPIAGLLPILFLILTFIISINAPMAGLGAVLFKIISYGVDPLSNKIGYLLLVKTPALKGFWTSLYNMPVVPYTRFNNTIVLGSLVLGLLLQIPVFFLMRFLVRHYRVLIRERVQKWKVVQALKATSFFRYYDTYKNIRGQ